MTEPVVQCNNTVAVIVLLRCGIDAAFDNLIGAAVLAAAETPTALCGHTEPLGVSNQAENGREQDG